MIRPALDMTDAEFADLRRKLLRTDPAAADAKVGMARLWTKAKAKFPDLAVSAAPQPERERD